MTETWRVLLPERIDPAGPELLSEFATRTGTDEYDSIGDALDDVGRYDAVVVRVAELDAAMERTNRGAAVNVRTAHEGGIPESTVNLEAVADGGKR